MPWIGRYFASGIHPRSTPKEHQRTIDGIVYRKNTSFYRPIFGGAIFFILSCYFFTNCPCSMQGQGASLQAEWASATKNYEGQNKAPSHEKKRSTVPRVSHTSPCGRSWRCSPPRRAACAGSGQPKILRVQPINRNLTQELEISASKMEMSFSNMESLPAQIWMILGLSSKFVGS